MELRLKNLYTDFRDADTIKAFAKIIKEDAIKLKYPINIMEVCGTHTVAFFHTGVKDIFPDMLNLVDGPGCPVCVTANGYLDRAIEIQKKHNVILATFGDMIKVPASYSSLQKLRSEGGKIEVVYSPMDALEIAKENSNVEVVFLSVGFETTTPTEAVTVKRAIDEHVRNFSILTGNKLTPPAVEALLMSEEVKIDGFILPGHVSIITGSDRWGFLAKKFNKPAVISGFESSDLIMGSLRLLQMIIEEEISVENLYKEVVTNEGNTLAIELIDELFDTVDANWRGIGVIPKSGLKLKDKYSEFDAEKKFQVEVPKEIEDKRCRCGEVLRGLITPPKCPLFANICTPREPVGACMVSFEGACSAYYKYRK